MRAASTSRLVEIGDHAQGGADPRLCVLRNSYAEKINRLAHLRFEFL